MIKYRIDVAAALAAKGYTSYTAKKTGELSQSTMVKLKTGDTTITLDTLNRLCNILQMEPGDLIMYAPDLPDVLDQ